MKEYIPTPVNIQSVFLSKDLDSLVKEMLKNVHEVWTQTRVAQNEVF